MNEHGVPGSCGGITGCVPGSSTAHPGLDMVIFDTVALDCTSEYIQ